MHLPRQRRRAARAAALAPSAPQAQWRLAWGGLLMAATVAGCLALASSAFGAAGDTASAAMENAEGQPVGTVELTQMQNGTLVRATFENLPEGTHAFHIHTTGQCEPPFTSAGGHYNPANAKHGFDSQGGPHAGDMPNIHVPASGQLTIEVFNTYLEVDDQLLDQDGAAVMIHDHADDYETDPAGDAGPRIACGVLKGPN